MELRRRAMMGMEVNKYMKLVGEYTFAEGRENNETGNAQALYDLLLSDLVSSATLNNVWVVIFENNQASNTNYKVDFFCASGNKNYVINSNGRNNRQNCSVSSSSSRSLYVSAGTVAKIYQLYAD